MLPPIASMLVNQTKDTNLLTILGVTELFNVSQSAAFAEDAEFHI